MNFLGNLQQILTQSSPTSTTNPDKFWKEVESTHSLFKPDQPITIRGKTFFDNSEKAQQEMFSSCNITSQFVLKHLQPSPPKTVLDLECGTGANSEFLLNQGTRVTAIDNAPTLLEQYKISNENRLQSHIIPQLFSLFPTYNKKKNEEQKQTAELRENINTPINKPSEKKHHFP